GGLASSHTGNPIHVVTGNKYQQEVDLTPLPGTLGLLFKRHYNSHNDEAGPLGHGWGHSYDLQLKADPNSDSYRLRQSDGRVIHFQPTDQTDHYSAPRVSDGWLQVNAAQLTWHWRDGRQLQFSPEGKLQRIVLATGQTVRLLYNPQGDLFLVRDPQGRELSLDHYPNGRIKALYDPTGQATRYRYDEVGNLKQVTRADDSQRRYHYEDPHDSHNLTGITDERGIRYATWAYDNRDRAILSTHADQVGQVKLDFSTPGETQVTDSQGKLSTYTTEIRNGVALVSAIHGPGCSSCGKGYVSYRYNERLQLSETATNDGITKRYRYDAQGRTSEVTQQANNEAPQTIARYEYADDQALKPSAIIRPSVNPQGEHRLENRYNPQGQATQITERGFRPETEGGYTPIERTTRLDYDSVGNLTAIDGPRDDVEDILRLEYDDNHRITTIIGPEGSTLHVENYDDYGRPTQLKSGTQILIGIQYTPQGQIARVDQRGGKSVSYRYTETGKLKGLTGPDGRTFSLEYDGADRAIGITGLKGARTQNEIDTEGRLREQHLYNSNSELIRIVSYLYDAHGRLTAHQDQNGRQIQYRYDEDSRLNAIEGPNGIITELQYNGLGQLLSITQPDAGTTQLHYDSRGRASGVTDARSNRTQYLKDDFGRIVRIENPDSGTTQFIYDPAGNPVQKRDAQDNIVEYRYDAANRLFGKKRAWETTNLRYDRSTGQLILIQASSATERFKYHTDGKLTQHTRSINGKRFTTRYNYDPISRQLSSKQLPDGQILNYHYYTEGEQRGQLRAVTREGMLGLSQHTIIGEIDQDPSDGVSGLVHGNGIRSNHRYDANGRLTALENDQTLQLRYRYDEQGNVSGIDLDNALQHYRHDRQGRLTRADTALGAFRYQYDALGNRIRTDHTDPQGERSSDAYHYLPPGKGNRLSEKRSEKRNQAAIYQYNASGSPTQAGDLHYAYNTDQRPSKVYREVDGRKQLIAEYGYNGFGERIKKISYAKDLTPAVTYYLYDGSRLSAEINGNGEMTAQYLYLGERPVAKLEGNRIYAIHTDHLGAPRAATDDRGRLVWQADYSPFGQIDIRAATITLNLRLPGQYADRETGQYYNYLRTYNPETGRYLTADPIGLKAGLNRYAYVSSDPLHGIDPLGLFLLAFDGTWIDRNSTDPEKAVTSNVELFRQYYEEANGLDSTRYIRGVGTGGRLDSVLGAGRKGFDK
ncbi:MAG: RHS domain-containing protein, partial [Candidatus Thiodiazotropha sp. (ex Ustalcina ferruginea)]|nr:RHS domain-containing protein [Candidatus Thiodiazotropha sp. (ex Ustalcina ferruginea)]